MNITHFGNTPKERRQQLNELKGLQQRTYELGFPLHVDAIINEINKLNDLYEALPDSTTPNTDEIITTTRNIISAINHSADFLKDASRDARHGAPIFVDMDFSDEETIRCERKSWIIDGWLPENELTILTGRGGFGKTTLILQMCCKLAHQHTRDGIFDSQVFPGKDGNLQTVYASWEDNGTELKNRLLDIALTHDWINTETISKSLHCVDMLGAGPFWGPDWGKHNLTRGDLLDAGEKLLEYADTKKTDLLIIDPTTRAFRNDERDKEGVAEFCTFLQNYARNAECAILLVQHPPRARKEDEDDAFGGSAAWYSCCRSMWGLLIGQRPKQIKCPSCGRKDVSAPDEYYKLHQMKNNRGTRQADIPLGKLDKGIWLATTMDTAIASFGTPNTPIEGTTEDDFSITRAEF